MIIKLEFPELVSGAPSSSAYKRFDLPGSSLVSYIGLWARADQAGGFPQGPVTIGFGGGTQDLGSTKLSTSWQFFEEYFSPAIPATFVDIWAPAYNGSWCRPGYFKEVVIEIEPVPLSSPSDQEPGADDNCDIHVSDPASPNPIRLRNGNKLLSETDLIINSVAEPLTFTRAYLQNRQGDTNYQFMGRGWTHNHAPKLSVSGSAPYRAAQVILPNGGLLKLDEDSTNQGHFNPRAGSDAYLDVVGSEYVLTSPDQSKRVFELHAGSWRIKTRTWPSGDAWNYAYNTGTGRLEEVSDQYGRKLVFRYHASGSHAGQLYRVGDHTFNDTGGTPTGRYVEFNYITGMGTGTTSLLEQVKDVRGKTWKYVYNTTNANQPNFLLQRLSPPLEDAQGNPLAGTEIALEKLTYTTTSPTTITAITQRRGLSNPNNDATALLQTDFSFNVSGSGNTEQREAGLTGADAIKSLHKFPNGVYKESINPLGNKIEVVWNNKYRPLVSADENGDLTFLSWDDPVQQLERVKDPAGSLTTLEYDNTTDKRLQSVIDPQGHKTLYRYDARRRQPAFILFAKSATPISITGGMETTGGWTGVNSPSTNALVTDIVDSGTQSRHVIGGGAAVGIQSVAFDLVANHIYVAIACIRLTSGQVAMRLRSGTTNHISVLSSTELNVWQTVRLRFKATAATPGVSLQFVTSGGPGNFHVDSVHLIDTTQLNRWQEFVYDSKMRVVAERVIDPSNGLLLQEIERSYATSGGGNGLVEIVTLKDPAMPANNVTLVYTYDAFGRVIKTQRTSLFGTCEFSYTVYDLADQIVATVCGPQNTTPPASVQEALALYTANHDNDGVGEPSR